MNNIKQLERWAWLLDNSIRIPGTSIKMGLDSLIGLIPGVGDITGGALSSYILLQAVSSGVAPVVIARMAVNIMFDTVIGMIPIVGDIFDVTFKANLRNIELMANYYDSPREAVKRNTLSKCDGGIRRIHTHAGFAATSLSDARSTHKQNRPATSV